jgi:hypothetical protein
MPTQCSSRSDSFNFTKWKAWGFRPLVLFAAVYTIVGILHELTHAVFAYFYRIPFTLLHTRGLLARRNEAPLCRSCKP